MFIAWGCGWQWARQCVIAANCYHLSTFLCTNGCAWAEAGYVCADQWPLCAMGHFGQVRVQSPPLLQAIPVDWLLRPLLICRMEDSMLN